MRLAFFVLLCMIIFFTFNVQAQEVCNEGDRRRCGTDVGVCETGIAVCKGGKWVECVGCKGPISEIDICGNGIDDDCDGEVDEGCFPWISLILVGLGILFIGIGLYYMQKGKGERILREGLGKD